jgi:threonine aldolase
MPGVGWLRASAVFVEDTHGEAGGRVWPLDRLVEVAATGLPVHLDGARLWNAAVAAGHSPAQRAAAATTVMCCLSKGLGAPVGSLLAGPADLMAAARTARKRLGGGMRQAGVLAAAGLVALERIDRLAEDHARARRLAEAAAQRWPGSVAPRRSPPTSCGSSTPSRSRWWPTSAPTACWACPARAPACGS